MVELMEENEVTKLIEAAISYYRRDSSPQCVILAKTMRDVEDFRGYQPISGPAYYGPDVGDMHLHIVNSGRYRWYELTCSISNDLLMSYYTKNNVDKEITSETGYSLGSCLRVCEKEFAAFVKKNGESKETRSFRKVLDMYGSSQDSSSDTVVLALRSEGPRLLLKLWSEVLQSVEQTYASCGRLQNVDYMDIENEHVRAEDDAEMIPRYDRLTVFQAEPIVWFDKEQQCHRLERHLDFESERKALRAAIKEGAESVGATIDIDFKIASTNQLSNVVASGDCLVLHISGHGTSDYLALENEWGGALHAVGVGDLKKVLSVGRSPPELVFISTCYSQEFGQAFVELGVPHVVCCRQSHTLKDNCAVEFESCFYRELSRGKTLLEAFRVARVTVAVSPSVNDSQDFLLLPQDSNHDVAIFYSSHLSQRVPPPPRTPRQVAARNCLPPPPQEFVGREMEMHEILKAATKPCLIQISGPSGAGKSALARAACNYIGNRKSFFQLEEVHWLYSVDHACSDDNLSMLFRDFIMSSGDEMMSSIEEHFGDRLRSFYDRRSLIFIDSGELGVDVSIEKLQAFLDMLRSSVSVVLVCPYDQRSVGELRRTYKRIELAPLNMRDSVTLFGSMCKFVKRGFGDVDDFVDLLVPEAQGDATSINKSMSRRCSDIFRIVGQGFPEKALKAAESMTSDQFENLMKIALREEFNGKIHSRHVLEQEVLKMKSKLSSTIALMDYEQADDEHAHLKELEHLRASLPTVTELRKQANELALARNSALKSGWFLEAKRIQQNLEDAMKKIEREEKAMLVQ